MQTTCENAYVHVGIYKIKPDAPPDAVDTLSKNFFAPALEKMLADGAIFEWETDTYADPKDAPGTFLIAYLSATKEGLDKAHSAVQKPQIPPAERSGIRFPDGREREPRRGGAFLCCVQVVRTNSDQESMQAINPSDNLMFHRKVGVHAFASPNYFCIFFMRMRLLGSRMTSRGCSEE